MTVRADRSKGGGWQFQRTISLDSMIVLIAAILSGIIYFTTLDKRQEVTAAQVEEIAKNLNRVEEDMKDRTRRIEDTMREQNRLLQEILIRDQIATRKR
jgi:hypothetical protein